MPNIFFAIVGGLIFALAVLFHALTYSHGGLESDYGGLLVLYGLGSYTMLIHILGAYGAYKQDRVSLILFLVCMIIGSLVMLSVGVPFAFLRSKLVEMMEDTFKTLVPLEETTEEFKNIVHEVQERLHCCGLFSYKDWRNQIPDSCWCDAQCMTMYMPYHEPCYPLIVYYVNFMADVVLGVSFALAILAVLGMVLSSILIHQLRDVTRATMVFTMPPVFNPQPPKYQELYNRAYSVV